MVHMIAAKVERERSEAGQQQSVVDDGGDNVGDRRRRRQIENNDTNDWRADVENRDGECLTDRFRKR